MKPWISPSPAGPPSRVWEVDHEESGASAYPPGPWSCQFQIFVCRGDPGGEWAGDCGDD